MCGKFTQMRKWRDIVDFSTPLERVLTGPEHAADFEVITPMRRASVLHLDEMGRRTITPMRWGFPGPHATSAKEPPKFIHARAETIDTKPTFAEAFRQRRGVVPVHSFNEGEEVASKVIQYTIRPLDDVPLYIAVIWQEWQFPDGELLPCFVMATVEPNELIAAKTDRMPAIIAHHDLAVWLGETDASLDEIKALLRTVDDEGWEMNKELPKGKGAAPSKAPSQGSLF